MVVISDLSVAYVTHEKSLLSFKLLKAVLTFPLEGRVRLGNKHRGTDGNANTAILIFRISTPGVQHFIADFGNTDILIVEDIIDSGKTLSYLVEYLKLKGAKSVKTCTLLDKPDRREVDFEADWVGKIIPNEFVVGYGLDFDEKYRALPYVGILKPSVYEQ